MVVGRSGKCTQCMVWHCVWTDCGSWPFGGRGEGKIWFWCVVFVCISARVCVIGCTCVCVCVLCVCVSVRTCVCVVCVLLSVHLLEWVCVCLHACLHARVHVCVCMYVGVSVCVCSALLSVHLPEFVLPGMSVCVHISVCVTCFYCDLAVPVIFSLAVSGSVSGERRAHLAVARHATAVWSGQPVAGQPCHHQQMCHGLHGEIPPAPTTTTTPTPQAVYQTTKIRIPRTSPCFFLLLPTSSHNKFFFKPSVFGLTAWCNSRGEWAILKLSPS